MVISYIQLDWGFSFAKAEVPLDGKHCTIPNCPNNNSVSPNVHSARDVWWIMSCFIGKSDIFIT